MGAKKLEGIDINSWKEVVDFAKSAGVSAKELYNYTINKKGFKNKTDINTMAIGCLVYDALQKKDKHKPRAKIINLRKKIIAIKPNWGKFSQQKLYENAYHALKRTPSFVKFDKKVRKEIF
mgnify:CR=1 FL=1